MKKLVFKVEIEFQDKITSDAEIEEVTSNVLGALKDDVENFGLSPEESETFVTKVTVSNEVGQVSSSYDFLKETYS